MTDEFELELEAMANGGAALARHEGRVIFTRYTLPGDRARVRISADKGRFAEALPEEILTASPDRAEPECSHFGVRGCGGCQWQHASYDAQLRYKREVLIDQLARIGDFDDPPVAETIPSSPWNTRHQQTFHVTEAGALALPRDDREAFIPIAECPVLHPALLDLLAEVEFDEADVTTVQLKVGSAGDDPMLVLTTPDDSAPELLSDLPVSVNLLLSDNEPVNLIGSPQVHYEVFGVPFRVTVGSFFHGNARMVEAIVEQVIDALALTGDETVLELYSGVGTLTGFIAARCDLVVSVESYPPAVSDAEINLEEVENVDLVEGPAVDVLGDLVGPFEAAVVDPPPSGLEVEVIDDLVRLDIPRLVYVGHDPATLARDLKRLVRHGYTLEQITPIDMIPQTYHVTAVALLVQ